ncbi:phage antirepressor KilAC domain-containing protein [Pseudomonas sp. HMWF006]|uniref:phage antirepressor KilAC domain-containing protein n=1 Tax=Pseudomonas sp. HMWF006 TaxID=2056843 RepID=UPI000D470FB5|nr:phage antirepressor KilAC domain-containing protein [Pseudomonas sp. HMWF006]PTT05115.1 DNA-binding protein [Pseudomonas sp. HMWF006]PTT74137.1 DNA-binding protein [Pseudomonas sp. HMWF007]PTT94941.1 DNA-binding protein [Pseudomonas sp. HMWF005]
MNTIVAPSNTVSMSSREIADLTGKQHKDVIRDIRVMRKALSDDGADLRHLREIKDGRDYTAEFHLDRVLTETLLTGYSIPLRHRVVTRLAELENVSRQVVIPQNLPDALRLAADLADKNGELQRVIEKQAPKVAAITRLAAAGGAICITDAAKQLGLAPARLFSWLEQHRWIFRRHGCKRWVAYQPRITSGYMTHKVTALKSDPETGIERAAFDPMVTPKGLTRLAELLQEAA